MIIILDAFVERTYDDGGGEDVDKDEMMMMVTFSIKGNYGKNLKSIESYNKATSVVAFQFEICALYIYI